MAEIRYPPEWASLKYPQWRLELLATLKELGDLDYQKKAWIEESLDKDVIVGARQAYHSLFKDLKLGDEPEAAIGCFLFDAAELAALKPLIALLQAVKKDLGEISATACLANPDWPEVVASAATARAALAARGEPTGGG